ncbi:MAG: aspartate aminotransferase family protein [Deltaproteobacteria bacterium]|nr:aspartate aminotransferase family protein [Deltaproteobacteria bacterium]MCL5276883.1 aspartate aminotransferase family protein [Deltaproteobacteria bacterium]
MARDRTIALTDDCIMHTYKRVPIVITRGKGVYLWDSSGKRYIDFLGARGAANTGYSSPEVVRAITAQAKRLVHVTNDFYTRPQAELARLLVRHSCAEKVFFCNSGAEANETAIKLSRLSSYRKYGPGRYVVITAANSFHGRTYGALSATAQKKYQTGFEPMVPGFRYVQFNDTDGMGAALGDDVCAVMLEPVQGEGGVYPGSVEYMKSVREQTQRKDVLLIMDEVQVGLGRTGRLFAYENYGIRPDIVTLAKSIAGGVPMGAVLAGGHAADVLDLGTHGTTFGGAPIAAAAGVAAVGSIIKHRLSENAKKLGSIALKRLLKLKETHGTIIKDVRGMGLIIGIEFYDDRRAAAVYAQCLKDGLITNITNGNTIRFLPPLVITRDELGRGMDIFEDALSHRHFE